MFPLFHSTYLAIISCHLWPELPRGLEHLPVPGPEAQGALRGALGGALPPHGGVQAVDGDVLHHLRAQQPQEVHLDSPDVEIQLEGDREVMGTPCTGAEGGGEKGVPVLCCILHPCPELDLMSVWARGPDANSFWKVFVTQNFLVCSAKQVLCFAEQTRRSLNRRKRNVNFKLNTLAKQVPVHLQTSPDIAICIFSTGTSSTKIPQQ